MLRRLDQDREFIQKQREQLEQMNLTEEQINRAMEPALSFHEQLKEEVEYYERIKRGDFEALINLVGLEKLLIGIRISLGISQAELARRLGVSEAQVSKDERNEYHGISLEKMVWFLLPLASIRASRSFIASSMLSNVLYSS